MSRYRNDDLESHSSELQELAASVEEGRRHAEAERSCLATILESMSDAVVVVDASGEVVLTNPAYERMPTTSALLGPEGEPLPADERPLARAARGESFTSHFTTESGDGARYWYEAAARPIGDPGAGTVLVIRDITERSLREFHEQFLAIASHELRTPLTVLQAYLQMLERQLGQSGVEGPPPPYLVKALAQTRRISELINNFLDVSRLQAGKLTLERDQIDLANVVGGAVEVARGLAHEQRLEVSGAGPLPVLGDAARLDQVLLNLLTNAIRYAPGTDRIDVRFRRSGTEALVEVEDYGPGIEERNQKRLFRQFHQVSPETVGHGLGLGLYIARQIVDLHGGRIGVRSTPGEGSTFWFALPIA